MKVSLTARMRGPLAQSEKKNCRSDEPRNAGRRGGKGGLRKGGLESAMTECLYKEPATMCSLRKKRHLDGRNVLKTVP